MRRSITSIALLLAAGANTTYAAPFWRGDDTPAPAVQPQPMGNTWGMGKWWGNSEPQPQAFVTPTWQDPPKPSMSTRVAQAFTNNPVSRAIKPEESKSYTPQPVNDSLSLSRPVGEPSTKLVVASAQLAERQGNTAEARRLLQQAVIQGPEDLTALRAAAHFEDRQSQFGAAEHLYRRAMAVSGGEASTLNDLALCVARQGRLAESKALFEQAIAKNSAKPLYRNNLATLLIEMGDEQGALAQLQAVHNPAAAQYNMGQLLARAGKTDQSAAYMSAAAALDPSFAQETLASSNSATTPLVDPRERSIVVESEPWSPMPSNLPIPAASEPWSPAPQMASQDITPIAEPTATAAPAVAIDNNGPKLLPPVR